MAENILIISSTSGNNFTLAKTLNDKLETFNISPKILNLEDFELPLFKPGVKASSATIEKLTQHFVKADGFIFCSPEYNGGLTPILTNAITWISTGTDNWRDAFNGKACLIATFSGGPATRFLASFRTQLEYLGMLVMPRTIATNNYSPLKDESVEKTLKQFLSHV